MGLHVGVNLLYLRPGRVGGSEVYVRHLVEELPRAEGVRLTLYCSAEAAPTFETTGGVRVVTASTGAYSLLGRLRAENLGLRRHVGRDHPDVLWSPANFAAPLLPSAVPQVATIHDLQHHWLPEHFSRAQRAQRTAMFAATLARCGRVIAISEFTRRDLLDRYRVAPERVVTVLEGVDPRAEPGADAIDETLRARGITPPYFFYPAVDHRHKNHRGLLEAFGWLRRRHGDDARLVLVGSQGDVWAAAEPVATALGVGDAVRHLGFVDRAELFALMAGATALVFPSEFEGFGLPLLEAMQVGTPVIASDRASIPEVAGDAALLLDPHDAPAWADAMHRVLHDEALRADLVGRGERNVERFSWRRCAAQTLEVLRDATG